METGHNQNGDVEEARKVQEAYVKLKSEIGKVIVGQKPMLERHLIGLLGDGERKSVV